MRLFLALMLPDDAARALAPVQAGIPAGRAVPPEDLHLTLAFLGEVPDRAAEALDDGLAAMPRPQVAVSLTGLAAWPEADPRMIVALADGGEPLDALARKVRTIAAQAGAPADPRRFRPHVTLARMRSGPTPDEAARLAGFLGRNAALRPGGFVARAVTLVRSSPGRHGSIYEPLADYPPP